MTRREWRTLLVRARAMARDKRTISMRSPEHYAFGVALRTHWGRIDLLRERQNCISFMGQRAAMTMWGPITHRQTRLP